MSQPPPSHLQERGGLRESHLGRGAQTPHRMQARRHAPPHVWRGPSGTRRAGPWGEGAGDPQQKHKPGAMQGTPLADGVPPPGVLGHRDRHLGRGQEPRVVTPACRAYFPFLCVCLTCRRRALTLVSGQALRGQGPRCPAHRE